MIGILILIRSVSKKKQIRLRERPVLYYSNQRTISNGDCSLAEWCKMRKSLENEASLFHNFSTIESSESINQIFPRNRWILISISVELELGLYNWREVREFFRMDSSHSRWTLLMPNGGHMNRPGRECGTLKRYSLGGSKLPVAPLKKKKK